MKRFYVYSESAYFYSQMVVRTTLRTKRVLTAIKISLQLF